MTNDTTTDRNELLAACNNIASKESILDELAGAIEKNGYAGDSAIPKLAYLVLLTGMLTKPVSLVIKGPSGSGKSYSLAAGRQFVPETAYEQFEGMSEKALVYLPNLDLKNRHLVIGEASGMADGNGRTLLRQLLSEGRVRYATVQSSDKGMEGKELPTLEGPTGLIMTTTATGLHPEDESRMLSVTMNESPELIKAALMAQAVGALTKPEPIDVTPWHALYEWIKSGPRKAHIPYVKNIANRLPYTHDRIKRDFPQVISLIEAHALLHSFTREQKEDGTIVANAQDYAAIRALLNEPLSQQLAVAVPDGIRMVVEGVRKILMERGNAEYGSVNQTLLSKQLGRDASVISRNVTKAIELGYLYNENPGQGREARLRLGELELPSGSVLPPVEEIFTPEIASSKSDSKWEHDLPPPVLRPMSAHQGW